MKAALLGLLASVLLAAAPAPPTFEQIKADPNPEHRARLAIDFAIATEREAEAAYTSNDLVLVAGQLKTVQEAVELADSSFDASGKKAGRNPGPYKYAEQRSRELLVRLSDLQRKMDAEEREMIDPPLASVQKIHDAWLEGIMGRKK